ncbi:MAG: hypothetical protein RLZZ459_2114 [Cyanobacteriota bacterium]|jgi:subtilisin family serine protease
MSSLLTSGPDAAALAVPLDGQSGIPFVDSLAVSALGASALDAPGQALAAWDELDFPALGIAGMAEKAPPEGVDPLIGVSGAGSAQDDLIAAGEALTGLAFDAAAVDGAGNSRLTARNLGPLSGTRSLSDWVGSTDRDDYYRFDITQASSLSLVLNGLGADADLQLLSSTGALLGLSANGGNRADAISRTLDAGTYYARVYRFSGDTNYNLTLSVSSVTPADGAGNTLPTARNIGALSGSRSFRDWVGSTDLNDYYRFDLAQSSNLSLSLNGMSADANLRLLSSTGAVLASSVNGGTAADSISRTLNAGTYYAQIYSSGGNTNYDLTLTAAAATPAPSGFNSTNGYGEASAERAIERLLNVSIPDLPNQFSGGLFGLDRIGAPEVWSYGYTGRGLVVAVLDTGVDRNHQDLDANTWVNAREVEGNGIDDDGNGYIDDRYGWNFSSNNNNTFDGNGHGTHVAGTIAAERNDFGVTGVAYDAKIMAVKVLSDSGSGSYQSIANGVRYAVNNGANVINLSLGGASGDISIQSAIEYAWNRGVSVVMAAGNSGTSSPGYPAAYANKWGIAVGAVDNTGALASFSNRAGTTVMDYVTAAGVAVTSTTPNNSYATYSGTSMATPHMAGAMALLMQANRASGRNLSVGQLEQLFTSTATNALSSSAAQAGTASTGTTGGSSVGRLALEDAVAPSPVTSTPLPVAGDAPEAIASAPATRAPAAAGPVGFSAASPLLTREIDGPGASGAPSAAADESGPASLATPFAQQSLSAFAGAAQSVASPGTGPIAGTTRDPLISPWERSRAGADMTGELDLLTGQLRGPAARFLTVSV